MARDQAGTSLRQAQIPPFGGRRSSSSAKKMQIAMEQEATLELSLEAPGPVPPKVQNRLKNDLQNVLRSYYPDGEFQIALSSYDGKIVLRVLLTRSRSSE